MFENMETNLYEEISINDFYKFYRDESVVNDRLIINFDTEPFTEKEKEALYKYGFVASRNYIMVKRGVSVRHLGYSGLPFRDISIYKSTDSYYYINFLKYYKCDEIEGVMNCLKKSCGLL
jgi:hypothetical protein